MPNWATTRITITGAKKDVKQMLDEIKGEKEGIYIDFNKIIPEPKTKEEYIAQGMFPATKEDHIQEDGERPWFNWYMWHIQFWGTKWNACESELNLPNDFDSTPDDDKVTVILKFDTAWDVPDPIMLQLIKKYDKLDLLFEMAEEQGIWGARLKVERGKIIEEKGESETDWAYDISEDVIGYSLRSFRAEEETEETEREAEMN